MKLKLKKPIIIAFIAFVLGHAFMEYLKFSMAWHGIYMIAFVGLFAKTTSTHNSVFVFRAIVPVVIGLGLVSFYRFLYSIPAANDFLSASLKNGFYLERLFECLSTLYAVCTAFLLWKGLEDHDNLRQVLKEESSQIQSILGYLNYLKCDTNVPYTHRIRKNLKIYIERIVREDAIKTHADNYQLLTETRGHIAQLEGTSYKEVTATTEVIKGLNNLFQIRMKRIAYMETRLSPYILIALSFMSMSIIYVLFTSPPAETVVLDTIIFIMGTLLSFMLMMLIDIGSPFEGYWKVKIDSFKQILDILDEEIRIHESDIQPKESVLSEEKIA